MFTRQDLISYLSDLEMAETNMRDTYAHAVQTVSNEEIKKIFKRISVMEQRHKGMVAELRKLIIGRSISEE